jgi:hypothetical protein
MKMMIVDAAGFIMDKMKDAMVEEKKTVSYIVIIFVFLQCFVDSTSNPSAGVITEVGHDNLWLSRREGQCPPAHTEREDFGDEADSSG